MTKKKAHPDIRTATFVASSPDIRSCPVHQLPEYAFIGRSNVGKSSLINMLTGIKGLAKISQTPGKTRLINHFLVNEEWYLVDLPGYGYARISQTERKRWKEMIDNFLRRRENLVCTFILVDSRHEPQKIDLEFMGWMSENQLPFVIIFTKTDKLSKAKLDTALWEYTEEMMEYWEELPPHFLSSAQTSLGRENILKYIESNNRLYAEYLDSKGS